MHWQGRLSLHKKAFQPAVRAMFKQFGMGDPNYCEPTHDTKSFSYVMKVQTRVSGPYQDGEVATYIPKCFRIAYEDLRPYQKVIYDSKDIEENRFINFVYCPHGNIGKTTICNLMDANGFGHVIPAFNDGDKIVQFFCSQMSKTFNREPRVVFVDIPRSMKQFKMTGMYRAIETITIGTFLYKNSTF